MICLQCSLSLQLLCGKRAIKACILRLLFRQMTVNVLLKPLVFGKAPAAAANPSIFHWPNQKAAATFLRNCSHIWPHSQCKGSKICATFFICVISSVPVRQDQLKSRQTNNYFLENFPQPGISVSGRLHLLFYRSFKHFGHF